jgi:tetratricopeptide (TPR) repeat protein
LASVPRLIPRLAVALLAALLARPAADASTIEEKVKAREYYQKGITHYDIKEYAEALIEFKNAYRIVQDPAFLFNIAQCYRKLGQDVEALDYYRNFLRRFPNAPNRSEVDRRIQELERELETRPPTEPKPDPRLKNGAPVTPIAPAPNGTAGGGPPLAQPNAGTAPTVVATPQGGGDRDATPIYGRWWFWTAVGAVVVVAGAAIFAVATRGEVGDCRGIDPCRTVGD